MNSPHNQINLESVIEALFLGLIFSLGFMQPNISVGGLSVTVTDVLFLTTGAAWLISLLLGYVRLRIDTAFYYFLIFAAALFLATLFSEDLRRSSLKFPAEIYLIGLAVLTVNVVTTKEMVRRVIIVWIAAGAIASLAGTLTVVSYYAGSANFVTGFSMHHYGSLPPGNYPRIQSTFNYPSMLCNYLTVGLMMLLAALKLGWIRRRVGAVLLLVFGITISFTLTPGIGGVLLAVGWWFWLTLDDRPVIFRRFAFAAGLLAALLFLLVSTFSLLRSPTAPYQFDVGGIHVEPTQRLLTWQGAAATFLDDPIFGRGLGLTAANVTFMPPSGAVQLLTDAHNAFLSVAAQAGLVGLVSIVLIVLFTVRRAFAPDRDDLMLTALGIAFVSAFIYQGLVGSFENARHLWVLIGLILAVSRIPLQERSSPKTS